jgi:hypothetical protein
VNGLICQVLYLPVALISIMAFTLANMVMAPVGYVAFLIRILIEIPMQTNSLYEAFLKFVFLIKFAIYGAVMIPLLTLYDPVVFAVNLYSEAEKDEINHKSAA